MQKTILATSLALWLSSSPLQAQELPIVWDTRDAIKTLLPQILDLGTSGKREWDSQYRLQFSRPVGSWKLTFSYEEGSLGGVRNWSGDMDMLSSFCFSWTSFAKKRYRLKLYSSCISCLRGRRECRSRTISRITDYSCVKYGKYFSKGYLYSRRCI